MSKINQSEIVKEGNKIILPENMSYDMAIKALDRQRTYEEEQTELKCKTNIFIWDGLIALQKAIKEIYGWATAEAQKSFFGNQPPELLVCETGGGLWVNPILRRSNKMPIIALWFTVVAVLSGITVHHQEKTIEHLEREKTAIVQACGESWLKNPDIPDILKK